MQIVARTRCDRKPLLPHMAEQPEDDNFFMTGSADYDNLFILFTTLTTILWITNG
jgi:hypothetical protein